MKALSAVLLALPILAVPLLLATTSGETAIRPSAIVVLATAVVFAVAAGTRRRTLRPWIDLPLAGLLGLAASHLLFAPGLPRGHDTLHHLWGIWAVAVEAAGGSLAALWLHGINLGTPLLQFYGPAAFYTTLPFSLAGMSPAAALAAVLLVFGALSAVTQCFAVTRWAGDRRAGLVAAAAYAFAPYRLLDVHYRAALGESAALAILPLVFLYGMEAAREGGRRRMAAAAAAIALLTLTHPISVLMAGLCLGIWTLSEALRQPSVLARRLGRLLGVAVLGAALAGFFVVPFVAGTRHLVVGWFAEGKISDFFVGHALDPAELVRRRLWSELQFSLGPGEPGHGTDREMPYYLGLVLLSLLPLGAGLGRLPGEEPSPMTARGPARGLAWMTAAAIAVTIGPMTKALVLVLPPIGSLQWVWRFLGPATCGAAALAGFAVVRLMDAGQGRRWAVAVPGIVAALLLIDAFPYTGAADWYPAYKEFGRIEEQKGCGRRWGCWEHAPAGPPGPFRIAGMFVPPPKPAPLALFCCAYSPEYMTPAAEEAFYPAMKPSVLARAGVQWIAYPGTGRVEQQPARPYASWWGGKGKPEPRRFVRGGGEIAVELDGRPGTVLVLEMHFPGWQVLTQDGWRDARPNWEGLLMAPVEAGQQVLQLRFQVWTPVRIAGCLLSVLTALGLLVLTLIPARRPA
ncbi:MAG TPA: 6-pyruvoyl-tetrahydropterin synthase-related protein [Thermoanaerobaculia bacterium]|nr:6-pyruvoyl-tetrahydropterin synthase-related protein [Thermoanaerobaculia bacterium]